ncbi:unnamed protein product [Vitrella brassicaformis CCMP3155]|uniref:Uncharacterized protein n=2 Tax=Vitrella brassicaformis TaxID=1169539 RepID=A0A0G4ESH3_VITBC|nr:unnamed protein product [Vitrella brassicaformis CCMP3155]|eukprot:CEM00867.1 unnamed protein product [Vitrella brassicaformis CCMP3155]
MMEAAKHLGVFAATPPLVQKKPVQVLEWGGYDTPSWPRAKRKIKHQFVAVTDPTDPLEGCTWYTRRRPSFPSLWRGGKPPFVMRLVQPDVERVLKWLADRRVVRLYQCEDPDGGVFYQIKRRSAIKRILNNQV